MRLLSLPDHGVKHRSGEAGPEVFDPCRRKWVALTPEEWVRQHFLLHLAIDLGCPLSLIATEKTIALNGLTKRADIVVHGADGTPLALVECKSPDVELTQAVFDQAARYNIVFKVKWLLVTNGMEHACCAIDHAGGSVRFVDRLPMYAAMR
jgi:hypothetical protein